MELFYKQYQPYLYKAARRIAKNYPSLEIDALVNEGFEGMLRALRKYESDYASFLTYAQYWINMKMNAYAHKALLAINLPGNVHATLSKYTRLLQENPTISEEELCITLGLTPKKLQMLQRAAALRHNSKDIDEQRGSAPYEDLKSSQHTSLEDKAFNRVISTEIKEILKKVLTEKERYVVTALFGLDNGTPKVLERVGKVLHVSKERVRQIKEFAFERIRESGALDDFI